MGKTGINSTLNRWTDGLMGLFFPRVCISCSNSLFVYENTICNFCLKHLPRTHYETYRHNRIEQLFWGRVNIEYAFSMYYFRKKEKIQQLMHEIKYRNNQELALLLGKEMGLAIKTNELHSSFDYLVPVPLHTNKLKVRGYNQSELIVKGISEITGIPYATQLLTKSRYTTTQTNKGRYERWENVDETFVVNNLSFDNTHFLLIDDVLTTGATLEACARALLTIPGAKVSIATLAVATD